MYYMNPHCLSARPERPDHCSEKCPRPAPPVYAFGAAYEIGPIEVTQQGTKIPLIRDQVLSGISVSGDGQVFSVSSAGIYRIAYHINVEQPVNLIARLTQNGVPIEASVLFPAVPRQSFAAEVILALASGDRISLEVLGPAQVISLQLGIGASLSIVKIG